MKRILSVLVMIRRLAYLAVLPVLIVLISACGDGGDGGSGQSTSSPAATTPAPVAPATSAVGPGPTATSAPTPIPSAPPATLPTTAPTPVPQSEAVLSASTTIGEAPLEVAFANLSTNADIFEWDFGDETSTTSTSVDEPVTHEYTKAGTYQIILKAFEEGQIDNASTATVSVTVNPGPMAALAVVPIEMAAGATQKLQVLVTDEYGNSIEGAEVTWSVSDEYGGSLSASGLLTAGQVAGHFENAIEAQASGTELIASAPITIVPGPLAQVVIAPDPISIGMVMKQQFVAVAADQHGNRISGLDFSWSVEEGGGNINASGLFTAGNTPGAYNKTVTATATQGEITSFDTASINVEPDRVVFLSDRNNSQFDVYVMNVDGTNTRRLTSVQGFSPSPSSNGRLVLYASSFDGIVEINDDGSWPVILAGTFSGNTVSQFPDTPVMSPDGRQIVIQVGTFPLLANGEFDTDNWSSNIHLIDRDGSNRSQLTDTDDGDEWTPAWSPDGTKIVYDFTPAGQPGNIWLMEADGSNPKQIAVSTGNDTRPFFSPDGTQIVFSSSRDGDDDIYVMNDNGANIRHLTSNNDSDFSPAWSADGSRIIFQSNRDGDFEIYVMDRNGANQSRLTEDPASDRYPRWMPRKLGVVVNEASVIIPNAKALNELAAEEVTKRSGPAVVRIETDLNAGSGFVFDADGLILTNNHVISGADRITVFLEDGTRFSGTIRGRDLVRDLAVIEIEATGLPSLDLGDVSRAPTGSDVMTLGFPLGLTGLTVTTGTASGIKYDAGRNITFVQTDATINPGNSGGPMFNNGGEVIGVVTSLIFEGFGLATSSNTIKIYLDRLVDGEVITD